MGGRDVALLAAGSSDFDMHAHTAQKSEASAAPSWMPKRWATGRSNPAFQNGILL